jgi:hypothetical protein
MEFPLVTYEQVAQHLPWAIRRAIEEGMPCISGAEHRWDTDDAVLVARIGEPRSRFPCRECVVCGVMVRNPDYRRA